MGEVEAEENVDVKLDEATLSSSLSELQAAAASGWWTRFVKYVSETCPRFDTGRFIKDVSSLGNDSFDDVEIRRLLSMNGADLTNAQFDNMMAAINPDEPKKGFNVFPAIAKTAMHIGPEAFLTVVAPILDDDETHSENTDTATKAKKKGFFSTIIETVSEVAVAGINTVTSAFPLEGHQEAVKEETEAIVDTEVVSEKVEVIETIVSEKVEITETATSKPGEQTSATAQVDSVDVSSSGAIAIMDKIDEVTKTEVVSETVVETVEKKSTDGVTKVEVSAISPSVTITEEKLEEVDVVAPLESASVGKIVSKPTETKRRSFLQTLVSSVEDAATVGMAAVSSAFPIGRSERKSQDLSERPIYTAENTVAAAKLSSSISGIVAISWWTRFINSVKTLYPAFNVDIFVEKLGQVDVVDEETLLSIFKQSGAPLKPEQLSTALAEINTQPGLALDVFGQIARVVRKVGSSAAVKSVLPIASETNAVEEIELTDAIAYMKSKRPESNFNLFEFINECQIIAPAFDVTKFFEAITSSPSITEESVAAAFKFAGLDAPRSEYHRLVSILIGDFDLTWLGEWQLMFRRIGVFELLLGYGDVLQLSAAEREAQVSKATRAFVTSVYDHGPKAKFDIHNFQNTCRALNAGFQIEKFIENLSIEDSDFDEIDLRRVFEVSGLRLSDAEFDEVLVSLCGDREYSLSIFRQWSQFARIWGISSFMDSIYDVLQAREENNRKMRLFLSRVNTLGGNAQFNLRGFVDACKIRSPSFDLQKFCDTLAKLPSVEAESLHECFTNAGLEIDPLSTDYSELLVILFGEVDVAVAAAREWRFFLRSVGVEWSVYNMWSLVDQRQRVEDAVKVLVTELNTLATQYNSRCTLRVFVERCSSLESGWHAQEDFDLRVFLEKLTDLKGDVSFGSLVAVFKACGINTTAEEYRHIIASIGGGNYDFGIEVFKRLVPFLRNWGVEWNMWIVWALLDEKEQNEETIQDFLLQIKKLGPSARFNLLGFIERCEALENSWHSEQFNIHTFMEKLAEIEGDVTFVHLERIFKECGIRTTSEEYKQLISTLGGDYDLGLVVLNRWAQFLRLWGVEWFLRAAGNIFERHEENDGILTEFETTITTKSFKFDIRSFVWACQVKKSTFNLEELLHLLVTYKGDIDLISFRDLLSQVGVVLTNEEYTALLITLTGTDDATQNVTILHEWILKIRHVGVRYYLFYLRTRWLWQSGEIDFQLAMRAFYSRIMGIEGVIKFDIAAFVTAARELHSGWSLRVFIKALLSIQGEITITKIVEAFKASGIDTTPEGAKDLLATLTGTREKTTEVVEELIWHVRTIGFENVSEEFTVETTTTTTTTEVVEPVEEKPAAPKEGWFSRVVRVVKEGAEAAGEAVVHVGEDIVETVQSVTGSTGDADKK
ncbi:hypothetical protein HDU76_012992 [Blyttiomyces sp. JEL0837]|nr:hypothetical protein HDU76_012992 [Blyttiomyces sp. JEL0837]